MLENMENSNGIIIKFDFMSEQTVGEIKKIVGLVKARYFVPIIDNLNLEANPRSSSTGPVTKAIQDSIETDPEVFPFKTKGVLLASSQYEVLERNRVKISPVNPAIEGILDGGHNTLAIGMYILKKAIEDSGRTFSKKKKNWTEFKELWNINREVVTDYMNSFRESGEMNPVNFLVPVELLVPRDINDIDCLNAFQNNLLEICAARNNNVQLSEAAKSHQAGDYKDIEVFLKEKNPGIYHRIEWKPNDGGDIKVQDIIALAWIPLSLITPVKDQDGVTIKPVSAVNIYSGKGACIKQFKKLMESPDVSTESADGEGYRHDLHNPEVKSALKIAAELPELYDYIYKSFPDLYNKAGGRYGGIKAVEGLNKKRVEKRLPFSDQLLDRDGQLSPEGYIVPLVYGLQALMEKTICGDHYEICWKVTPMEFLQENLEKIVKYYFRIFNMCGYDPQKIGKNAQSYITTLSGYNMSLNGMLNFLY